MTYAKALVSLLFLCATARAADAPKLDVGKLTNQPDEWFWSDEGRRVVANIVSWQNANGGWWKSYDVGTPRPATVEDKPGIKGDDDSVWHKVSTIDNGATYSELRILARARRVTQDVGLKPAFERGLEYLLAAQYPANGGWPQRFPLQDNYGAHITFNDDAMLNVMLLFRDIADGKPDFGFVGHTIRSRVRAALDRGIECIMDTQIVIDGKPTIWCQQHDAHTLAPAKARAYELPSLCTTESSAVTNFLMDIPHPNERVKASVRAAAAWFEGNKIVGKRVEKLAGPQYENGREVRLVDDPDSVIWGRFYDLETGKVYVCDRDGVKRDSIDQISHERRVGYAWYGTRPARVLKRYAEWSAQHGG